MAYCEEYGYLVTKWGSGSVAPRGDADAVVSDTSPWDVGMLGQLGLIPGWPGADSYPPSPMVTQTRHLLDRYEETGGYYEERVYEGGGHSPPIDHAQEFTAAFLAFLGAARA